MDASHLHYFMFLVLCAATVALSTIAWSMFPHTKKFRPSDLHVVAVFFNWNRAKSFVTNYRRFEDHMRDLGVTLHVVECVLDDMPFEVTDRRNKHHVQLRTQTEFFAKENLVNIGVENMTRLYPDWKYMAWIDADVTFHNPNVVLDTITMLNRFKVVQMWSTANDLNPYGDPMEIGSSIGPKSAVISFAKSFRDRLPAVDGIYGIRWHPGYAWAMRRDVWDGIGGLLDSAILGAADSHMAHGFIGNVSGAPYGGTSQGYRKAVGDWCQQAYNVVRGRVSYVPGLIHHHWHGSKKNRRYVERWQILVKTGFDPARDLYKDANGLYQLTDKAHPELHNLLTEYFLQRDDDANRDAA